MEKILAADSLTPILAYKRLCGEHKVILESIPRDKDNTRYSIMAYNPVYEIKYQKGCLYQNDVVIDQDPLAFLNQITITQKVSDDSPFAGGALGFVGYDMLHVYESIGKIPKDSIGTPDMHFFVYESYLIFDHKKDIIKIVEDNRYSKRSNEAMTEALEKVLYDLQTGGDEELTYQGLTPLTFEAHMSKVDFEEMVYKAKDLIRQGDMFQCVLSQRFSAKSIAEPLDYYRHLRRVNPSPYLYFFDFGEYQVIGASPESLVSVKGDKVTTNPIAGTRPRGQDDQEDKNLSRELLSDAKELAEHRMLVDLGRNDLGQVAKAGSVSVDKYMEVEYFRYVMHLTSIVSAQLESTASAMDALRATLPAGTVSGAPKLRAMQRIYELEKERRGIYAGAIGYLSATGDMDFAIAIRTMVLKHGRCYVQAGAGIVHDSIPQKEYEETVNKAKALTQIGEIV